MINTEYRKAMTELLCILNNVEENERKRIPKGFFEYLKQNADTNYRFEIGVEKSFEDLELKQETKGLLSMIYRNYLCDSEEEKVEFETILFNNEKIYQTELREKYNPDNLFKKEIDISEQSQANEQLGIVEYKETFFKRMLHKVKKYLFR